MLDAEPGWDSVTNPAAFTNGRDAESSTPTTRRASRTGWPGSPRPISAAITAAIQGAQQGLDYLLDREFRLSRHHGRQRQFLRRHQ
jgi:hypothetical protein